MSVGSCEHRRHFIFLSTMETKQIITFHYSKNCKSPRSVDSSCNLFCLYALEKITVSGNELKAVDLQTKIILLPNVSARIWLSQSFKKKQGLYAK